MGNREVIMNRPDAPYATAIKANGFLFVSGNVSVGRDGKPVTGDVRVQTRQVLENLKASSRPRVRRSAMRSRSTST